MKKPRLILLPLLLLLCIPPVFAANPWPIHQWQYTDIVRTGIDKVNSNATAAAWLTFSTNWNGSNVLQATDKFIGFSSPGRTNGIFLITASNLAVQLGQWITNAGGGAGSGDVTTAQLNAASNVLRSLTIANDTTTSNGLTAIFVANDTTTSNALRTLLIANDTTTSNGLVTLVSGNITTTSNGLVSFTMTASNTLRGAFVANASGLASNLYVGTASAGTVPLNVKGAGGQGQNLLEVRNSSDVILFQVASNGVLVGTGGAGPRLLHSSTAGYVWTATGTDGTGQWSPITGGGDVTTAQLNSASNLLSGRIDLALTNSETRKVILTTNLTVQGKATNQNGLTVLNAPLHLISSNGTPYLMVQEYGSSFPQLLMQNDNGTEATPTPLASGSVVGQFEIAGFGDTLHKAAFNIRPTSLATFGDSQSSTLVRFGIGDDAGSVLGKNMANWTAYNITNNVNVYFKSNLVVDGAALFNGSFTAMTPGGFLSTLSVVGTFTANTNAVLEGTNLVRWLKLTSGQPGSSFAILDANTNVVGWLATNLIPTQSQLGSASNVLQAAIDAKAGVIETMTNGVRVRLTTNENWIAGPNITILATNNAANNRTDYYIDAPSSALSDGDKGSITVSGAGTVWTIDDQAVRLANITNVSGFTIIGKATTGSGAMTEITAGTDSVLGRNGSGNLSFAALASSQIANNAVTFSKLQDISTSSLIGRSSAGTGDPEEITIGGGLTLAAGVLSSSGGTTLLVSNSTASATDNALTRWDGTSGQRVQNSGAILTDAGGLTGLDSVAMTNGLGVGGSGTFGDVVLTNRLRYQVIHLGNTTNIVLDCSKTNYYIATPSNTFTVSLQNTPGTGTLAQDGPFLYLVNTNSATGYFPTNNLNNVPLNLAPAPSTNIYAYHSNGTNTWMSDGQYLYTGTTGSGGVATNVLNVSPYLHTPTINNGTLAGRTDANILTNVQSIHFLVETRRIATNSSTSNLTVNFAHTNSVECFITNNITFTNWAGLAAGVESRKTVLIYPQLITRGVNWGQGIGYGVRVLTNAASPLWTSLTNGKVYAASFVAIGTNIFPTVTLWE